jgi:hypothetical protein
MSDRDLLWRLFLMVRDLENRTGEPGPTQASIERQQEWASRFHELAIEDDRHQPVDVADHDEDEESEDPHQHGVPHRPRTKRKR